MKNVVSKHAKVVTQALIEIITPFKKMSYTITSDNEFTQYKEVSATLDIDFDFANPYN